ncbi:MAG: hypothetical protein AAB625_00005, partial [Patescibacteria group bacterium]
EPPLITITNPVTYLRRFWDKVMGKEGAYFSVRIPPITAFLIAFGFTAGVFSIGRYSVNIPFLKYQNLEPIIPTASAEAVWKETAYTGKLQYSVNNQKYFLLTTSSEAITLEVPDNLDLLTLVGKRIMAVGKYDKITKLLKVSDAKDLEVLSKTKEPIPTLVPTFTPTSTPSATPVATDIIDPDQDQ